MSESKIEDYDVTTWRPRLGITVERAIAEAIIVSSGAKKPFTFPINGQSVSVEPVPMGEEVDGEFAAAAEAQLQRLFAKWKADDAAAIAAYRASPQYAEDKAKFHAEIVERQNAVNRLMAQFSDVAKEGEIAILKWLAKFVERQNGYGIVTFDKKYLYRRLSRLGYRRSAGVGRTVFDTRHKVAEYIIGQVMDAACRGYPPHPIVIDWIKELESKFGFAR